MKITRYYTSTKDAINVKNVIQNLLATKLERLIDSSLIPDNNKQKAGTHNNERECA